MRFSLATVSCLLYSVSCLQGQARFSLSSSPDSWVAPLTVAISAGALIVDRDTVGLTMEDLAALDREHVPAFDRPATYFWSPEVRTASHISAGIAVIAPILILTEFRSDYRDLMGMYLETLLLSGPLPSYTKALGRIRPLAYNELAPLDERMRPEMTRSFFSGHTSVSTAAGVFLATVYDAYRPGTGTAKALWVGGLGIGIVTGSLRIFSGMHFPSDVAVGFVVGAAVGYAVPQLHKRKDTVEIKSGGVPPPMVTFRIAL